MIKRNILNYWRWFAGFIFLFIVILIGLYLRMISVRSSALQSELQRKPPPVEVMDAVVTNAWKTINFLARVQGGQTINLRSDVSGWVRERKVDIGSYVEKDDVLLILTDERKDLALREAEARLISARANLKELNRLYKRNIGLFEKGIVAKDTQESLKNQIESQRAEVDALEAVYKRAKWDFDHLSVTSPIQGKIIEVIPDIGQEVMQNEIIVKLVNSRTKKVVAGVDSNWARILQTVKKVKLTNTVGNNTETAEALIIGISPNIDIESGTYSLEAEITDSDNDWLPGEIVNLEAPIEKLENVVIIPRSAVLSDSEKAFLFLYEDGKALKKEVSVTWLDDKQGAVYAETIPAKSKIIVKGNSGLAQNQSVRLVN